MWADSVRKELLRRYNSSGVADPKGERAIAHCARALVRAAMSGDIQALRELGDRIDGKALSGEGDSGIRIVLSLPVSAGQVAAGGQLESVEVIEPIPNVLGNENYSQAIGENTPGVVQAGGEGGEGNPTGTATYIPPTDT